VSILTIVDTFAANFKDEPGVIPMAKTYQVTTKQFIAVLIITPVFALAFGIATAYLWSN
jgi:hypothetical protein